MMEDINLCATDNPFERARKAWRVIGFVNDRHGGIGLLAEVFMAYRDLDRATPSNPEQPRATPSKAPE